VSSTELQEALEIALASHVVTDPNVRASHGIYASRPALANARPTYHVYQNCKHVFTATSRARAISVLSSRLEEYLPRRVHSEPHVLELDAAALVDEKRAILAPWILPYQIPEAELRVRRHGFRLLEGQSVFVDASSKEVVVPRPRLLTAVSKTANVGSFETEITPSPNRLPINFWLFLVRSSADLSRARAVAEAMGIAYRHHSARSNFGWLVTLIRELRVYAVRDSEAVIASVAHESGRPPP
jgi:hypothetical protein